MTELQYQFNYNIYWEILAKNSFTTTFNCGIKSETTTGDVLAKIATVLLRQMEIKSKIMKKSCLLTATSVSTL